MHRTRDILGQLLLRFTALRCLLECRLQLGDGRERQEGEDLEKACRIRIGRAEEELVKVVGRRLALIEVDRVALALSELLAGTVTHQRDRDAVDFLATQLAHEIDPSRNVTPLVRAANLETAARRIVEMQEVIGLQQGIAELRKAHPRLAGQACAHALAAQHGAHTEMLAHIAQKIQKTELAQPVVVIDDHGRCRGMVEIKKTRQVLADALRIRRHLLACQ